MSKLSFVSFIPAVALAVTPLLAQNSGFESTDSAAGDGVIEATDTVVSDRAKEMANPTRAEPQGETLYRTLSGPSDSDADTPTPAKCEAVKQRLAVLQSQEEVLWSSQNEANELYTIWSSPTCVSARRGSSNITQDLGNAMLLLKSNGTDIEKELAGETAKCGAAAASKWNGESAAFKSQHTKAALAETCMLNTRISLYAKALNLLNQNSKSNFDSAQADYERAQAKYEEEQRAYREERAEWERRSKLCEQGKIKYCGSE